MLEFFDQFNVVEIGWVFRIGISDDSVEVVEILVECIVVEDEV